ncbi:MerR family transcriptional regulator [Mycolicibacterium vaccae]|uniref:MerR family transcriptional regulator n=1 Tax=Mycolicibacterium vaccae TaxID=1810 RepID=UPI003D00D08C
MTIGQAAAFADITVKTVRHYHKLGLVDEPCRDGSGYRRYGSADLLKLVQVRTLAAAGVPLADIGELLDSGDARFAEEVADVERLLTARIAKLVQQRSMLRRMTSGDRMLLPDSAIALLEKMPSVGFTPDDVKTARESFILAKALVPESFDEYISDIEDALRDQRFVVLVKRSAEVATWAPNDPRVAELANDMAAHYLANPVHLRIVTGLQARTETAARYRLVAHHREEQDSAVARLSSLVETTLRAAGIEIPRTDEL